MTSSAKKKIVQNLKVNVRDCRTQEGLCPNNTELLQQSDSNPAIVIAQKTTIENFTKPTLAKAVIAQTLIADTSAKMQKIYSHDDH